MCGLGGLVGDAANTDAGRSQVESMAIALEHRGPDDEGLVALPDFCAAHRRLSILDLSEHGHQPMRRGPLTLLYNGEVYNYLELRAELVAGGVDFVGQSDSEVVLAAFEVWGELCLQRFFGMFALAIWDERDRSLFLARDRFGVKPLYVASVQEGVPLERGLAFASEIGALQAAGIGCDPDPATWSRFLVDGAAERGRATFWHGIQRLGAGEMMVWRQGQGQGTGRGQVRRSRWYDLQQRVCGEAPVDGRFAYQDQRSHGEVVEEVAALMEESVRLRFRSDVPVGINLSGGLDSSLLLALVDRTQGAEPEQVSAFTFTTGDTNYDELPWVKAMLENSSHPHHVVRLAVEEVPDLALSVAKAQREPAGGLATLAYAKLFEEAQDVGVKVLLDGQGMDEAWAGYDYYQKLIDVSGDHGGDTDGDIGGVEVAPLQGSATAPTRPGALDQGFLQWAQAEQRAGDAASRDTRYGDQAPTAPTVPPARSVPTASPLLARQLFDLQHGKLPRALRYNDRVSMRSSVELREPFLDHRLVELALRQPRVRKIKNGVGKVLPRELAARWVPGEVRLAPKRALQTPQREWLRGPLRSWAEQRIEDAVATGWLQRGVVEKEWHAFADGHGDNAFFVWQWIDLGMLVGSKEAL